MQVETYLVTTLTTLDVNDFALQSKGRSERHDDIKNNGLMNDKEERGNQKKVEEKKEREGVRKRKELR